MTSFSSSGLCPTSKTRLTTAPPDLDVDRGQGGGRGAAEQVQAAQNTLDEQTLVLREKISNAWADWAMAQQRSPMAELAGAGVGADGRSHGG